jgi:hypothetical protein
MPALLQVNQFVAAKMDVVVADCKQIDCCHNCAAGQDAPKFPS